MDIDKIFSLFKLFYDGDDPDKFLPVAELAADCAERRALDNEGGYDPRLYYLAAAETLCRVLEIKAAQERLTLTRTGAAAADSNHGRRLEYARELYSGYEALCAGIIRDDGFMFLRS